MSDDNNLRIPLACLRCRAKKSKCITTNSNSEGKCDNCLKASVHCQWPNGRKRKRTRKEMEEARQLERQNQSQRNDFNTGEFPTNNLVEAVTSRVAYIEDTIERDEIKVSYFRMSGNTALHPGLNRICIKLKQKPTFKPQVVSESMLLNGLPNIPNTSSNPLFDPISKMPTPSSYGPLLEIFFRDLVQFFPFLERSSVEQRLNNGTMSAFLMNAICGISVRFIPPPTMNPIQASQPYISQANQLLIELLRLPTTDTVAGLLILSYCEFGQNSESGLWQFSGIAIRMAFDLGLQNATDDSLFESPEEARRGRILFWTLFVMDRVLSFGTGRPSSMPEDVEIHLPDQSNQPPLPAFAPIFSNPMNNPIPWAFPIAVKMMILIGRISNAFNHRNSLRRRNSNDDSDNEYLQMLETQLIDFYQTLPIQLKWSVENLKMHAANGQGGLYLFIHVWPNAVIAFIHQNQKSGSPINDSSLSISLTSAQTICECLVFADLFTSHSYLASPFISQPLFIAACAFIHDARVNHNVSLGSVKKGSAESDSPLSVPEVPTEKEGTSLLGTISAQNFSILYKALKKMTSSWQGIGYIVNLLEQRVSVSGLDQIDFSVTSDGLQSFISLPDNGIIHRHSRQQAANPSPSSSAYLQQEQYPQHQLPSLPSIFNYNDNNNELPIMNTANIDNINNDNDNIRHFSLDELLSSHFIEEITASPTSIDINSLFDKQNQHSS